MPPQAQLVRGRRNAEAAAALIRRTLSYRLMLRYRSRQGRRLVARLRGAVIHCIFARGAGEERKMVWPVLHDRERGIESENRHGINRRTRRATHATATLRDY